MTSSSPSSTGSSSPRLRVLVLGGTAWLGRTVASYAAEAGHDVVCVARGSAPGPDGVPLVRADRDLDDGLAAVAGERWDGVVDVSRQPGQVRRAVRDLRHAGHVVFVSTGNVYADADRPGQDESAPLLAPLEGERMRDMEEYGPAKVACEQAVLEGFGDRATLARAGLIGGPGDTSDRTSYWPVRFARPSGPAVLAPDARGAATSVVDVRDLAAWLVRCVEEHVGGAFNATGSVVPLGEHLDTARAVAGHTGEVVWADPAWLVEQGVEPWAGPRSLPLWLPEGHDGFAARSSAAAYAAGLDLRPLDQTLADTLTRRTTEARPFSSGLTDDEERSLLGLLG